MDFHKHNYPRYNHNKMHISASNAISQAYKYVMRSLPETSPRTEKELRARGHAVGRRFLHLDIHK